MSTLFTTNIHIQNQSPGGIFENKSSEKFRKIRRRTLAI